MFTREQYIKYLFDLAVRANEEEWDISFSIELFLATYTSALALQAITLAIPKVNYPLMRVSEPFLAYPLHSGLLFTGGNYVLASLTDKDHYDNLFIIVDFIVIYMNVMALYLFSPAGLKINDLLQIASEFIIMSPLHTVSFVNMLYNLENEYSKNFVRVQNQMKDAQQVNIPRPPVLFSTHDVTGMAPENEILSRLQMLDRLNADLVKYKFPDSFCCPLNSALMSDPVMLLGSNDGINFNINTKTNTYERSAIIEYLKRNSEKLAIKEPKTGQLHVAYKLVSNDDLKILILNKLAELLSKARADADQEKHRATPRGALRGSLS